MKEIVHVLPCGWRKEVTSVMGHGVVEELRLRSGQALHYITEEGEKSLPYIVTPSDLEYVLARASGYSMHSVQEQIARGFLTMEGGHRIGLCGTAVIEQGRVKTIRHVSSLAIRVASEYKDTARDVVPHLKNNSSIYNTLILSPPGRGKTTLLRDVIRAISSGEGVTPQRVGVVDERSEIAGMQQGIRRFDLGQRCDVLEQCPKKMGLLFLLRSMNPQVLAVDEITEPEDVAALTHVFGCGVKLLVTAHGDTLEDLYARPCYRALMEEKIFQKLVRIHKSKNRREYIVEDLPCYG